MKKLLLLTIALLAPATWALPTPHPALPTADDSADGAYPYLTLTTTAGRAASLAVDNLELTFADGQLRATNAVGTATYALSDLASMHFSATPEGGEDGIQEVRGTGYGVRGAGYGNSPLWYDLSGRQALRHQHAMVSREWGVRAPSRPPKGGANSSPNEQAETQVPPRGDLEGAPQTLSVVVGSVTYLFPAADAGLMTYTDGATLTVLARTFALADVTRITVGSADVEEATASVAYDDDTAAVTIAGDIAHLVDATVSGAHVRLAQSSETEDEITYSLSGNSTDGELYLSGTYKTTVELRGLTLTNTTPAYSGAALHLQNGKRVALSVKSGTTNSLTDCATPTDALAQKAAIYCKGHLELKGKGALTVRGTYAHGIKSGEYMTLKNADITVAAAAKDGISCNQYLLMQSGTLSISGTGDDALQCDIDGSQTTGETTDHDAEDSGNIYIEGGTLSITTAADGAKALKAEGDVRISGGDITVTQTGIPTASAGDLSYVTAVKADKDVSITGGTLLVRNAAGGGRGISADGTVSIDQTNDDTPTHVDITVSANGGTATTERGTTGGGGTDAASYTVYLSVPTTGGGGGGPGGGGGSSGAWKTVYLYRADGTLLQQLTATVTKTSGYTTRTFYYYDFKTPQDGTFYFKSDNYTSGGGWGGGTTYTIQSATFDAPATGKDVYYTMTSNGYTTSGTTRTYTLTNATSTWADADSGSGTDGYTAKGIKADAQVNLAAGTITITATGSGGKGIKSGGTYTQGHTDGSGPLLTVTTTGSRYGSGGGGGNPWGGQGGSSGASAKAIKAQGAATIYGGQSTITTQADGAEGLESKTSVDIRGGHHYLQCYDDCINSSGNIYFNGGVTVCYSNGNDAVDSNAGRTGAITIGDGTIFAFTSKGSPEEGLDCDNNAYIQITGGGTAISAGGSQGGGGGGWGGGSTGNTISGAAQGYTFLTSTISYTAGRYYTLADAAGQNLVTYSFPVSVSSTLSLVTAKGMTKGSTYTIKYATTPPTDAATAFHGLYLGSTAAGTTQVTSFTAQ